MGLTLSEETSNRVSEVVLPPRLGRNEACHCGSGSKYKRCCWERDEALRRQLRGAVWPAWMDDSRNKLRQFEKYVCNVRSEERRVGKEGIARWAGDEDQTRRHEDGEGVMEKI